ncbi:hypothetical protein QQ045_031520 [Rhodiola kirilowii]
MAETGHTRPPDNGNTQVENGATTLSAGPATKVPPTPAIGLSFAAVTKAKAVIRRFPPIQLAARHYGLKDGKPAITITSSELQVGIDNLKHSLVAKFAGGQAPIEEVRKAFLGMWAVSGPCSIGAWDARHILIVLDSDIDARKVLSHPVRKLGHSLFRIFRWSKDFSTKREPTRTTTWVRLVNLPPEMYHPSYMESIVSTFGNFLSLDNNTSSFTNPSHARVCIEVDTSQDLPDEVWIATGSETSFWLKLLFENKLLYCTKCRLHGHQLENCKKVKQRLVQKRKHRQQAKLAPVRINKGNGVLSAKETHQSNREDQSSIRHALGPSNKDKNPKAGAALITIAQKTGLAKAENIATDGPIKLIAMPSRPKAQAPSSPKTSEQKTKQGSNIVKCQAKHKVDQPQALARTKSLSHMQEVERRPSNACTSPLNALEKHDS